MRLPSAASLLILWLALGSVRSLAVPPASGSDERLVRSAGLATDGPSLLAFLGKRSGKGPDRETVARWIKQLGATSEATARDASRELVLLGSSVAPALREAARESSPARLRARAAACLPWVEGQRAEDLACSVVRLTARLRPAGAVAALLAYLPAAEGLVAYEIDEALTALTTGNKPDPVLVEAVRKGTEPACHAAAEALSRSAAHKLLTDRDPGFRLRLALAFLERRDGVAVPVLIELLAEMEPKESRPALYALRDLAGPLAPKETPTDTPGRKKCRDAWAAWWEANDGASLLRYFRERTPTVAADRVEKLVANLGSKSFQVREKAGKELVRLRGLAVPLLKKALGHSDPEVRRRAENCLREIENAPKAEPIAARVRLLALRKPPGAAQTLLAYAPFTDDRKVAEEVRRALLTLLALADDSEGTAKVLAKTVGDSNAVRRALAARVLAHSSSPEQRQAVRRLLDDPEPSVRYEAARGLALAGEKEGVQTLIALLDRLPDEQTWEAEELLQRLAGEKAPAVSPGSDAAARKRFRETWAAWWKDNGKGANLRRARPGVGLLGYTIVSLWNGSLRTNEIVELGRDGKPRWKIDGLGYAFDFVFLPGSRLLCAEHNQSRVTERNLKGEVLWEYKITSPIDAQRLPGGDTFVAATGSVVIVDRQGKETLKVNRYNGIMAGQWTGDGGIVLIVSSGECIRLDAQGKEVSRFRTQKLNNYAGLSVLPNGNILIAFWDKHKVQEYNRNGKVVWEKDTPGPGSATRLPNGHTLITSQPQKYLIEVDRAGKTVWEYRPPGMSVWRARRR
jgi:HEAT repeats/PQQ-like domain